MLALLITGPWLIPTDAVMRAETQLTFARSTKVFAWSFSFLCSIFTLLNLKDRIWSQKCFFLSMAIICLPKSMHKIDKGSNCMNNALHIWGKVQTGYVSATMRSMLPQHRKKERRESKGWGVHRTTVHQVVNIELRKAHKELTIWEKPKHSLKPQYRDK